MHAHDALDDDGTVSVSPRSTAARSASMPLINGNGEERQRGRASSFEATYCQPCWWTIRGRCVAFGKLEVKLRTRRIELILSAA
mmetsp:Transcript_33591/g.72717  ORF Transcript_33591/g.72717 Transcript_33591/m.72717 type:complete len:84 (-) Transcript_33591:716-967(-)